MQVEDSLSVVTLTSASRRRTHYAREGLSCRRSAIDQQDRFSNAKTWPTMTRFSYRYEDDPAFLACMMRYKFRYAFQELR